MSIASDLSDFGMLISRFGGVYPEHVRDFLRYALARDYSEIEFMEFNAGYNIESAIRYIKTCVHIGSLNRLVYEVTTALNIPEEHVMKAIFKLKENGVTRVFVEDDENMCVIMHPARIL